VPELPEVEIIKIFLAQNIVGLRIKSVEILNEKSFIGDFALLTDKKIISVGRRAKVLRIGFESLELLIHLKMSGQIVFKRHEIRDTRKHSFIGGHPTLDMFGELPNKSTRVIINLSDDSTLFFNDQRKFGWMKLLDHESGVMGHEFFGKMGPEPLGDGFSLEVFKKNLLRRKKTPVKVALLDQEVVAGIGNIYACETCFLAGVDPRKKVLDLHDKELQKLYEGIIESLKNGIKYGGSSKTHFANPEGKKGLFLDYAFVYGREKLPCKNCGSLIQKIKLGGRGTFYCSQCQVD